MQCLGMPIPQNVRDLLEEPPHMRIEQRDYAIQVIIRNFGRQYGIPENEIDRACDLASGLSDIVVLLERPADGHNYSDSFEEFVRKCEALRQLDQLIRFASKGRRSIYDVTVLDAYTFQPNNKPERAEKFQAAWFEELWRILKVKKPKIIVSCWGLMNDCSNESLVKLRSNGVGFWPVRDTLQLDDGPIVFVMRSFHPSTVVSYGERKPHCLLLLICHFVLSFALLAGNTALPGRWLQCLCARARRERKLRGDYTKKEVEQKTISVLERMMGPDPMFVGGLNSLHAHTHPADERVLYAIRRYLGVKTGRHADFMELAKLCHMWNHSRHRKRGQVVSGLSKIAARQRLTEDEPVTHTIHVGFADEEDDADGILEDLSNLQIGPQESEVDRDISSIQYLNRRSFASMEQARQLLESAAELDLHMTTCFTLGFSLSLVSSEDVPYLRDSAAQVLMSLTQQIAVAEERFRRVESICKRVQGRISDATEESKRLLATGAATAHLAGKADVLLQVFIAVSGLLARFERISMFFLCADKRGQLLQFKEHIDRCDDPCRLFRRVSLSLEALRTEASKT